MSNILPDRLTAKHYQPPITKLVKGTPVSYRDVVVKEIKVSDSEDPDLLVAEPIWQWQQTEQGQFVMQHAEEAPYWVRTTDFESFGTLYQIVARLSDKNETFWRLKWGSQ